MNRALIVTRRVSFVGGSSSSSCRMIRSGLISTHRLASRAPVQFQSRSVRRFSTDRQVRSEVFFFAARMASRLLGHLLGTVVRSGVWSERPYLVLMLTLGAPLSIVGAFTLTFGRIETVPFSDRLHLVWMSEEEERSLSESASKELFMKEGSRMLPKDHPTTIMVQEVVDRLFEALVESDQPSPKDIKLTVIESAVKNAFVLPNGSIYVYTGILPIAKTTAGLASIIGHEMSHALAHHSAEKVGIIQIIMLLTEFIQGFRGIDSTIHATALQVIILTFIQLLLPNAHSRKLETEADRIGIKLATLAGYDPAHAAAVWQRMNRSESTRIPQILSTHPSCEHREKDLREKAEELSVLYQSIIQNLAAQGKDIPDSEAPLLPHKSTKSLKDLEDEDQVLDSEETAHLTSALLPSATLERISTFLDIVGYK